MAQRRESKFLRSGMVSPLSVRKLNLQPNRCIPRMLEGRKEIRNPAKESGERSEGFYLIMSRPYLKVKMNSISSMQNVATLSMVFISTTSCLLRAGRKRTSFSTRSSRKVRRTDRPPSD